MVSSLIKRTAGQLHMSADDTQGIVVAYTNWLINELLRHNAENKTLTFLDLVELSTGEVNLGLAYREPLQNQLRVFCKKFGYDYNTASNVLSSFANEIVNTVIREGSCTVHGVGRFCLSDKQAIRFWSSSNYSRQGYSIRSAVNPSFRSRFNKVSVVD